MKKSLVSVIIPCYNYAHFLAETVESVIQQTYTSWECIIVDDGSTDNSAEIGRMLEKKDNRIKYIYQENQGLAASRNRGYSESKGEFIQFLDADDLIDKHKLNEQVLIFNNNKEIGVCYTNYQTFNSDTRELQGRYSTEVLSDDPLKDLLFKWEREISIPIHSALFRRYLFEEKLFSGKPFIEEMKAKEDWLMWAMLAINKIKFFLINKDYALYRMHSENMCKVNYNMGMYLVRAMNRIYSLLDKEDNEYKEKFLDETIKYLSTKYFLTNSEYINSQLFIDTGNGFNVKELIQNIAILRNDNILSFTFDLKNYRNIKQIRFDPLENQFCRIRLHEINLYDSSTKYEFNFSDLKKQLLFNGRLLKGDSIDFDTLDPQIIFPFFGEIEKLTIKMELWVFDLFTRTNELLQQKEEAIKQKDETIQQKEEAIKQKDEEIKQKDEEIKQKGREIKQRGREIKQKDEEIRNIYFSRTWRWGKKSATIINVFFSRKSLRRKIVAKAWSVSKRLMMYISRPVVYVINLLKSIFGILRIRYKQKLISQQTQKENSYVKYTKSNKNFSNSCIKLVAFYLPQFHPIPENDKWWGKGFTEWTNVNKAKPQFNGHYQPHIPDELGYYDLRIPEVMIKQANMAKNYGIYGFCYHYYWFSGGKRLLEMPLFQMLNNKNIEMPFMLCWANEPWSRRWDGSENDVLMPQDLDDNDILIFIQDIMPFFKDERYIKIDNKPILIIYRVNYFEKEFIIKMVGVWREYIKSQGFPDLYLVAAETFAFHSNPEEWGLDAAVEFPPHNCVPKNINSKLEIINKKYSGIVYDFNSFLKSKDYLKKTNYLLFKTVFTGWDNTPRKRNQGNIFHGTNPETYEEWLEDAVKFTKENYETDKQFVFINAWNEWGEGTHLEPDKKYGYAWLHKSREIIERNSLLSDKNENKIIIVSHDCFPAGAQYLVLFMAKELVKLNFDVEIICLYDGLMKEKFLKVCPVHDLSGFNSQGEEAHALSAELNRRGFKYAIVNTTVSGIFLATLKKSGIKCIALIHELNSIIEQYHLQEHTKYVADNADYIVFAAPEVRDCFSNYANISPEKIVLCPQGLYKRNSYLYTDKSIAKQLLRKKLKVPYDSKIVLCVGYADFRKGVDVFIKIATTVSLLDSTIHFVWVGNLEASMDRDINELKIIQRKTFKNIHFVGHRDDTNMFYAGADIYALTSREDPFPTVVQEAMEVGLPIVAFSGSGGCNSLIDEGIGLNVPMGDEKAFANAIIQILRNKDIYKLFSEKGPLIISDKFSFRRYIFNLLQLFEVKLPRISVIVPNYNYARYIINRLDSIINQTIPIYELIILDDASTDDSVNNIKEWVIKHNVEIKFIVNERNTGNVFTQWVKGVSLAKGDLIWIAEADDLCENTFLESLVKCFEDKEVAMSYCNSVQINASGKKIAEDYNLYLQDISYDRWLHDYICDGADEIKNVLAIKNTIPNVSGVLFKREILLKVLKENFDYIKTYRYAGDWLIYVSMLAYGKIFYKAAPCNFHRRHMDSVISDGNGELQYKEIVSIQNIISGKYPIPEEVLKKAEKYLEEIKKHFGL